MMVAYVNEMSDACEALGIDIHEVCRAAGTKPFGYAPFTPSLAAGGPCISVNPFYLLASAPDGAMPLLRSAAAANLARPARKADAVAFAAMQRARARSERAGFVSTVPKVLVVGLGFKRGERSTACSPSVQLARVLEHHYVQVSYADDRVDMTDRWARLPEAELLKPMHASRLDGFDAIVVAHAQGELVHARLRQLRHAAVFMFAK